MPPKTCCICHCLHIHRIAINPKIKTRVVGTEGHRNSSSGVDEVFPDRPFSQMSKQIIKKAGRFEGIFVCINNIKKICDTADLFVGEVGNCVEHMVVH